MESLWSLDVETHESIDDWPEKFAVLAQLEREGGGGNDGPLTLSHLTMRTTLPLLLAWTAATLAALAAGRRLEGPNIWAHPNRFRRWFAGAPCTFSPNPVRAVEAALRRQIFAQNDAIAEVVSAVRAATVHW